MGRMDRFDQVDFCYVNIQIVDTGVLEDVEGLVGGRLGLFCKSQVSVSTIIGLSLFDWLFHFRLSQENVIWSHMEAKCSNSDIDFNLVNPYDH